MAVTLRRDDGGSYYACVSGCFTAEQGASSPPLYPRLTRSAKLTMTISRQFEETSALRDCY